MAQVPGSIELMRTLAERLKQAREARGWSQAELAQRAKVSAGTIGNLEAGIRKTARNLTTIATALGVRPEWLADGAGPQSLTTASGGHPWPFETISPQEWDALTERQRGAAEDAARQAVDRAMSQYGKRVSNGR